MINGVDDREAEGENSPPKSPTKLKMGIKEE